MFKAILAGIAALLVIGFMVLGPDEASTTVRGARDVARDEIEKAKPDVQRAAELKVLLRDSAGQAQSYAEKLSDLENRAATARKRADSIRVRIGQQRTTVAKAKQLLGSEDDSFVIAGRRYSRTEVVADALERVERADQLRDRLQQQEQLMDQLNHAAREGRGNLEQAKALHTQMATDLAAMEVRLASAKLLVEVNQLTRELEGSQWEPQTELGRKFAMFKQRVESVERTVEYFDDGAGEEGLIDWGDVKHPGDDPVDRIDRFLDETQDDTQSAPDKVSRKANRSVPRPIEYPIEDSELDNDQPELRSQGRSKRSTRRNAMPVMRTSTYDEVPVVETYANVTTAQTLGRRYVAVALANFADEQPALADTVRARIAEQLASEDAAINQLNDVVEYAVVKNYEMGIVYARTGYFELAEQHLRAISDVCPVESALAVVAIGKRHGASYALRTLQLAQAQQQLQLLKDRYRASQIRDLPVYSDVLVEPNPTRAIRNGYPATAVYEGTGFAHPRYASYPVQQSTRPVYAGWTQTVTQSPVAYHNSRQMLFPAGASMTSARVSDAVYYPQSRALRRQREDARQRYTRRMQRRQQYAYARY